MDMIRVSDSMDTPAFIGMAYFEPKTGIVTKILNEQTATTIQNTWIVCDKAECTVKSFIQTKFHVSSSAYTLFFNKSVYAVAFKEQPFPLISSGWSRGAYLQANLSRALSGALGAMIGAALGMTFDNMTPADVRTMLQLNGVNTASSMPFYGKNGLLNITGPVLCSAPGTIPETFSSELLAAISSFSYNGFHVQFIQKSAVAKEQLTDVSCLSYENMGYVIMAAALSSVGSIEGEIVGGIADLALDDDNLETVCIVARNGGANLCRRLAGMCMYLGLKHGSSIFPPAWRDVTSKPKGCKSLLTFTKLMNTIQYHSGILHTIET
jgi:hypothetical protein